LLRPRVLVAAAVALCAGVAWGAGPAPAPGEAGVAAKTVPAYPSKPIRFIIPYPPGGLADTFARALGEGLVDQLGQPVLAENRPGGSLIVGAEAAAKSAPDGYTLFLGSVSSLAINLGAFRHLPYDPVRDFAPVSLAFYTPLYLVVSPDLPVRTARELIDYARLHPGRVSFASLGYGSSVHLAAEMFKSMAGLDLVHVPYKGTTTALPDILAGRVNMIFDGGAFLPQVQAGKARLLAVTSPQRLAFLPDVPTLSEAGVPGYDLVIWFGVVVPSGVPAAIIERLSRAVAAVEHQAAFRERFFSSGVELVGGTPQAFGALIKTDIERWTRLFRAAGVQPE
jgi:tripartite-type tricarboxylate transporter receptor subunit TctC